MSVDLRARLEALAGPLPELDERMLPDRVAGGRGGGRHHLAVAAVVAVLAATVVGLLVRPAGEERTQLLDDPEAVATAPVGPTWDGDAEVQVVMVTRTSDLSSSAQLVTDQARLEAAWRTFEPTRPPPVLPAGRGMALVPVEGTCRSVHDVLAVATAAPVIDVVVDDACAAPVADDVGGGGQRSLVVIEVPAEVAREADDVSVRLVSAGQAEADGTAGWRPVATAPLSARFGSAAEWTGDEFVVWGGYAGGGAPEEGVVADGAAYDPVEDVWRSIPDAPIEGAHGVESFWTGEEMWVLGGFGGRAGRDHMTGVAAYRPASDTWRVLPDLPAPPVAAAWIHDVAVVIGQDGRGHVLTADAGSWAQVAMPATSGTPDDPPTRLAIDPPFAAADGPGGLLVVDGGRALVLTGARQAGLPVAALADDLGLRSDAQDQAIGIIGPPEAPVVIGPAGTAVHHAAGSAAAVIDPVPFRAADLLRADDQHVVAVAPGGDGLAVLDTAARGWRTALALPDALAGRHSPAAAAGDGMLFMWGGGTSDNLPGAAGAVLTLSDPAAD